MDQLKLPDGPGIIRNAIKIKHRLVRNAISELVGTFLLIFIGLSIIAQQHLFRGTVNTWVQINVGWGFAITISVIPVAHLSGGQLNPAMTIMFFTMGMLDAISLPVYIIAQHIGAFLGAVGTYVIYRDAINAFDGGVRAVKGINGTAGIFSTYPSKHMTLLGTYLDQIAGTGLLAFCVMMVVDPRNKIPPAAHPVLLGISLLVIGCGFGVNCGYPLNPARDFGPRIFTYFIYGKQVFTHPWRSWFLVPIIAPIIGALIGGWSYVLLLGSHIPDDKHTPPSDKAEKHESGTGESTPSEKPGGSHPAEHPAEPAEHPEPAA